MTRYYSDTFRNNIKLYRHHAHSVPKNEYGTGVQIQRFRQSFNANECTNTNSFTKSVIKMNFSVAVRYICRSVKSAIVHKTFQYFTPVPKNSSTTTPKIQPWWVSQNLRYGSMITEDIRNQLKNSSMTDPTLHDTKAILETVRPL
jgi:hypothetical protein